MANPISVIVNSLKGGATVAASAAAVGFDPVSSVANLLNTVLGRILPDKEAQNAAKLQLAELQINGDLANIAGQIQTNIAEAANAHVFVSGWRPYVGWICGTGLAYEMLLRPLLTFVAQLCGSHIAAPAIETQDLLAILGGILGLGAARTIEKVNGVPGAGDSV